MTNPDQIWAEAVRVLERGKPFVLATVVNVRGSTPREVGAKMIVREDGQFGTIGGGCGEAEVFRNPRFSSTIWLRFVNFAISSDARVGLLLHFRYSKRDAT